MLLARVEGNVVATRKHPSLTGWRLLVCQPINPTGEPEGALPIARDHFQRGSQTPPGLSKDPSLVVYDNLGGGVGQTIGYVEGREAAQPFDEPTPIDAINAALVDDIFYNPLHP